MKDDEIDSKRIENTKCMKLIYKPMSEKNYLKTEEVNH